MKKITILFALIAALVLTCGPSEPEKFNPLADPDFVFKGGEYQLIIPKDGEDEGFTITKSKQYRVIVTITALEEPFIGSRMFGKLLYKNDINDASEEASILSGWNKCKPEVVVGPGIYKWTFEAGNKHDDGAGTVFGNDGTTPTGATQYFWLQAQTGSWETYPANQKFGFKGGISVAEYTPPTGTLTKQTPDISVTTSGSGHDPSKGKGNIEGDQFERLTNAGSGAVLKFCISGVNVTADNKGYAVGNVGNFENIGETNPNPALKIPDNAPVNSNYSFDVSIDVEDALAFVKIPNESHLFINMYDGKCDKVELWEYVE